jgi:hypothetical protein
MTPHAARRPAITPPAGDGGRDLLAAALTCARRGWQVFPLRPGSKQPALHGQDRCPHTGPCRGGHRGWEQRATTDPRRIQVCWGHSPGCNPGIACGPSGLVVIDLDVPKDGAAPPAELAGSGVSDGAGLLARLCARHGQPWPVATFTVATPSGGRHLYFTVPAGLRLRNTAGQLGWCIDTRAAGGYVLAPGSVTGGRPYRVITPAPAAPLPHWLARRLAEPAVSVPAGLPPASGIAYPGYAWAMLECESRRVAGASHGQRNDTLNRAAFALGQLTATGLLPTALAHAELFAAACQAGLDRDPGCGRRGIAATIRSGMSAGACSPRRRAA